MTSKIWYDSDYYGMSRSERKVLLNYFQDIVKKVILGENQKITFKDSDLKSKKIDFLAKEEIDGFTELGISKARSILKKYILPHRVKGFERLPKKFKKKDSLHIMLFEFFEILQKSLDTYAPNQPTINNLWTKKIDNICKKFWE